MTNYERAIYGGAWALLLSGIAAILILAVHPLTAHASVNWKAQTCTAFTAYQAHPAAGSLATLVIDSTHLGKSYLKSDMLQVAADASSPSKKAWKYLTVSEQYASEDCYGGA